MLIAAVHVVLSPLAAAHPPYERAAGVLGHPPDELTLAKSYIDGIVFSDPVKLVVRNNSGVTVVETDYGRDLAIICLVQHYCLVFQYDGLLPVTPTRVWRLSPSALVPDDSTALWLVGIVAPYKEHWLGYLVAVAIVFALAAGFRAQVKRPRSTIRSGLIRFTCGTIGDRPRF